MNDKRWQYKVFTFKLNVFKSPQKTDALIEERLARLGMEGWELVNSAVYGQYIRFFMKRS
jgi:hypothetical protein